MRRVGRWPPPSTRSAAGSRAPGRHRCPPPTRCRPRLPRSAPPHGMCLIPLPHLSGRLINPSSVATTSPGAPASPVAWSTSGRSAPAPPGDHAGLSSAESSRSAGVSRASGTHRCGRGSSRRRAGRRCRRVREAPGSVAAAPGSGAGCWSWRMSSHSTAAPIPPTTSPTAMLRANSPGESGWRLPSRSGTACWARSAERHRVKDPTGERGGADPVSFFRSGPVSPALAGSGAPQG